MVSQPKKDIEKLKETYVRLFHTEPSKGLKTLEDFLMWELSTLQYDAITVCFPSRDPSPPNSLVSLKPNPLGTSSC